MVSGIPWFYQSKDQLGMHQPPYRTRPARGKNEAHLAVPRVSVPGDDAAQPIDESRGIERQQ